jgi:hypothetical protein
MRITAFFLILLMAALAILPSTVYATGGTPTPGGKDCSWEGFKNAVGEQESGNNYGRTNVANYLGRWQFGEARLADMGWYSEPGGIACGQCGSKCPSKLVKFGSEMICYNDYAGTWTGKAKDFNINSSDDFLNNSAAQDAAFADHMALAYKRTKKCHNKIGQQACGCTVTLSGILAAAHVAGEGGACSATKKGPGNYSIHSGCGYLCRFSDFEVPAEVTGGAPVASTGNCQECKKQCTPKNEKTGPTGETGGTGVQDPNPTVDTKGRFEMLSDLLKGIWVAGFGLMTSEITTTMMQQMEIIGTFFDAKHHLETQRLMQQKYAEAHKDYQPSVQMCEIGTFVRNLADSEQRAKLTQTAIARAALDRALAAGDVKTVAIASDDQTRREDFIAKYCNKEDNAKQNKLLCRKGTDPERRNADINFTQIIDMPLTLKMNLVGDQPETEEEKIDKENIFAFLDYIFMHDRFVWKAKPDTTLHSFVKPYMDMRSLIAMRSVAQNSFAYIISEKAQGPKDPEGASENLKSVAPFLRSLMKEMGLEENEINETIGKHPSYYAQMEVLTKKIYQHPEFVANLYDKPANVKRLRAAMTAIKVMQDRDMHKALMRREMLMSLLLELKLRKDQREFSINELGRINSLTLDEWKKQNLDGGKNTGTGLGP